MELSYLLQKMGKMISSIAKGVSDLANSTVSTYNKNGELISKRQLKKEDFKKAGQFIEQVLTSVGTTIKKVYSENATMFSGWTDSSGDNNFLTVIEATNKMGKMISTVGESIAAFANLEMLTYDNQGNIISRRKLDTPDITKATDNIDLILDAMFSTLQDVYDYHSDIIGGEENIIKAICDANEEAYSMIEKVSKNIQAIIALNLKPEDFSHEKNKEGKYYYCRCRYGRSFSKCFRRACKCAYNCSSDFCWLWCGFWWYFCPYDNG